MTMVLTQQNCIKEATSSNGLRKHQASEWFFLDGSQHTEFPSAP